jgi:hypothetical protein
MGISATLASKSTASLSLEAKGVPSMTWDDSSPIIYDTADFAWDAPKIPGILESKSTVSLSLESK